MPRLIDADALQRLLLPIATGLEKEYGSLGGAVSGVMLHIDNAPTVDAAPVVHGRCEYCKDGKSFIGARMLLGNDGKWHDINNCPNCGAKMDGDKNA